jgi:hypothetical protein
VPPWLAASAPLSPYDATHFVDEERRRVPLARFAVAMPAVYLLVTLLVQRTNADQLRAAGHQFRIDWTDAQRNITPPPYHAQSNALTPVGLLVGLLTVVAVIIACIWQHKAASAARALGLPARHSPGWGVGAWFVPVVSLWMPYQAVSDCLPAGHAQRPRVLHWWLAWLVANVLTVTAGGLALFSTGAALAVSIPAALASLVVIAWAPGIVLAIAAAHQEALAGAPSETGLPRA